MWFDKVKFLNGTLWWPMSAKPTTIIATNLQTLGGNNYVPFLLIIVSLRFTCGKKNNWSNINKFQNDHGIWHKSGTVIFKRESFWHLLEGADFYPKKNFLILTQQNSQFSKRKIWSDFSRKKNQVFQTKKFIILVWKGNSLYLREKINALYFRSVLNKPALFFMLSNPNEPLRALACGGIYVWKLFKLFPNNLP